MSLRVIEKSVTACDRCHAETDDSSGFSDGIVFFDFHGVDRHDLCRECGKLYTLFMQGGHVSEPPSPGSGCHSPPSPDETSSFAEAVGPEEVPF